MRRLITVIALVGILSVLFFTSTARPVLALSIDDYFTYTYTFAFSKTSLIGSETFMVTASVQASCKKDLPVSVSTASIVSKVVARHLQTGTEVILNARYSIDYLGFPNQKGQTASVSVQVPLSFPNGSPAGEYNISGRILEAKVSVLAITIDIAGYLPSSQAVGTVTYSPTNGSGAGGGIVASGPSKPEPITDLTKLTNADGELLQDVFAKSVDGMLMLTIPKGTRFTVEGANGSGIVILEVEKGTETRTSEGQVVIGKAYNLGPEGAIFTPLVQMVLSYDPVLIPVGVQKKDLIIAWWDTAGARWIPLKNRNVDEAANTIAGTVDHFATFAIIATRIPTPIITLPMPSALAPVEPSSATSAPLLSPLSPASFVLNDLIVTPSVLTTGGTVTVTVLLTNDGDFFSTYEVVMKLDGQIANSQNIELAGKSSQMVTFTHLMNIEGQHSVAIGGLSQAFFVSTPQLAAKKNDWWLISGLVGLGLGSAIGYSIIFASRRKKSRQ